MPESSSGPPAAFPSTIWSEVLALKGDKDESRRVRLEQLIHRYWRPVYWAIRCDGHHPKDEAGDLTQEFFIQILEGKVAPDGGPDKGSFRSYLRGALKYFLLDELRTASRQKRGGGRKFLNLDFDSVGHDPPDLGSDPQQALDRAWAQQIMEEAVRELEEGLSRDGRLRDVEIFRTYDLNEGRPPSYKDLAARLGIDESEIWNILRYCRRQLRAIVLKRISPYVGSEAELLEELRELFGN